MKSKTIKSVLRRKFNHFVESIKDDEVKQLVSQNTIITGGCIASMLLRERINDFDLYFRNKETVLAVARYYVNLFKKNPPPKLKSGGIRILDDGHRVRIVIQSAGFAGEDSGQVEYDYFENGDDSGDRAEEYIEKAYSVAEELEGASGNKEMYHPVFMTGNAITLSDAIQLVVRFYGEPEDVHANFDFVHCMNYWTSWYSRLVLRSESLECLLTKELRYVGSRYPFCSVIRTRKFINKGWTINAGQYLKMLMQVSDLDLDNIDVLEDQLVGVDAAYFMEIISLMREHIKGKEIKCIDRTYLAQLIERIF